MSDDIPSVIGLHKAILWEEAKGKLRAMVMAGGAGRDREPNWLTVNLFVEKFITDLEDQGFNE